MRLKIKHKMSFRKESKAHFFMLVQFAQRCLCAKKNLQNEIYRGRNVIHIKKGQKPQKIELCTKLFTLSTMSFCYFKK